METNNDPRTPQTMKAAVLSALVLVALAPAGHASHGDGEYDLPATPWDTAELDVLVVPPTHGPISVRQPLIDTVAHLDPDELDPYGNLYLAAVLESIADWEEGVAAYGDDWLVGGLVLNVYVVGQEPIPEEVLADPEIVVTTAEEQGAWLGAAVLVPSLDPGAPLAARTACVVTNTKMHLGDAHTYRQMYGLNAHEFGHCLGLGHPGADSGTDYHPQHDVMGYGSLAEVKCVSNLDVVGLELAFGGLFGHPSGGTATMPVADYEQYDCTA